MVVSRPALLLPVQVEVWITLELLSCVSAGVLQMCGEARRPTVRVVADEIPGSILGSIANFTATSQDHDYAIATVILVTQLPPASARFLRGEYRMPLQPVRLRTAKV